jgi:hypothetical protein
MLNCLSSLFYLGSELILIDTGRPCHLVCSRGFHRHHHLLTYLADIDCVEMAVVPTSIRDQYMASSYVWRTPEVRSDQEPRKPLNDIDQSSTLLPNAPLTIQSMGQIYEYSETTIVALRSADDTASSWSLCSPRFDL